MDQSDASTASFGAAAAAADRVSASHNSSPGTIEAETLTVVREVATGRARSRPRQRTRHHRGGHRDRAVALGRQGGGLTPEL